MIGPTMVRLLNLLTDNDSTLIESRFRKFIRRYIGGHPETQE